MQLRSALFALLFFVAVSQARINIPHKLVEAIASSFYDLDHLPPPAEYKFDQESQVAQEEDEDESAEYESDLLPDEVEQSMTKNAAAEEPLDLAPADFEDNSRRFLRKPCLVKRKNRQYNFVKTYPRPWEHDGFEASLPKEFDWRNVNGVNYCSPNRNQHIPVYCGSCWVFGSTGALNDRFNIARKNRWPMTMVSPQEIIDCNGHGTCQGGEVADVYEYAKTHGLVEEGCNNYKAINEKCDPFHRCGSCWPDNCFAIQNYTRYYIKDWGKVSGRENMMAEIQSRGPIACTIGATPKFELNYTSGVYSEKSNLAFNHIVSVSGWGVDAETNNEYWIVRNSWGEAWGERGWYRVVTSTFQNGQGNDYNMGIEKECYYVDPDVSNLD